jgi:hypothetical protein
VVVANGAHGGGVHGDLESVGAKGTRITIQTVGGCVFALGTTGIGSFAMYGGAGDHRRSTVALICNRE